MEILIDLDENVNLITRASFVQDFRDTYSKCSIVFSLPEDIDFGEGSGFVCWGIQWEAISYRKISMIGGKTYSVMGYPSGTCSTVDKKYTSLSGLAKGFDVAFDSKVSEDLKFEFPLHNVPLGALLYKYRYNSIEVNVHDPSKAWFLFYDQRGLVGQTYSSLAKMDLLDYDINMSNFLGGTTSFVRDYWYANYCRDHIPAPIGYKKLITSFIGDKFDIRGRVPGVVGRRYKLKGGEEETFSNYNKLILVRQEYNTVKNPVPWVLTFGQLLVG
jgi:hypothetical protein